MAKNPSERFASLKAVADELATILKSPAAKTGARKEQPASSPAPSPAGDRMRADVGASQVLKSLKQKTVTESDLASLEELARKCYSRRDFEQVIQIIERIPEERRNAGSTGAVGEVPRQSRRDRVPDLRHRRSRVRLNDRPTALKKAEDLLKIKPGHHRALRGPGEVCRARRRGRGADRRLASNLRGPERRGLDSVERAGLRPGGLRRDGGGRRDLSGQNRDRDRHPGPGRGSRREGDDPDRHGSG